MAFIDRALMGTVFRALGRKESPDLRFFLQAFREADPSFGEEEDSDPAGDFMSREWLIRRAR